MCIAASHATAYASTSTSLPNVIWSGTENIKLAGKDIKWPTLRSTLAQEILDLELFFFSDVLFGVTLETIGFNVDERTEICDDLADTTPGYSMFSDFRNPFKDMEHKLPGAFFDHPKAAHLQRGLDGNNRIVWDETSVSNWLLACERASRRLLFVMHAVGGQPGRGVELSVLQVSNAMYRVRNFYFIAPGRLIYVLFYGKSTSATRRDCPIAHAVPWRVGRLFLIMHAVVNPLVAHLTQRVTDDEGRSRQIQAGFGSFGRPVTSVQLADEIQHWFERHHNVSVRLLLFRHLVIAVQKHLMPEAFGPVQKALSIVDAQAGHSSETADRHYAI